jgi:two-component system, OmpR family, sensor histidine kinase CpxA
VHTDESGEKKRSVAEIPRMIAVDVADRGPGVPEESLGLLFRAFYRTDAARRDTTGGFGVGLSIAERAIHLHGGTVFARNRDKGGLIVSIRLLEQQTEAAGS